MSKVSVTVRLPAELVAHLDEKCSGRGDRTRIIEGALRAALGRRERLEFVAGESAGRVKASRKPVSVQKGSGVSRTEAALCDGSEALLERLGGGNMTERDLAVALDWPPMRVARVVARLMALGRVRYDGGGVEAVTG